MARLPSSPNGWRIGRNLCLLLLGWTLLLGGILEVRRGLNQSQHRQDWLEKLALVGVLLRANQQQ